MANPQPADAHLRVAHSINEAIIGGTLRKSTAQRILSLTELIEKGIMPAVLPCDSPCPRANKLGESYLFHCESCSLAHTNPYYNSAYKKTRIPVSLRWAVWERDNFTCQICGKRRYLTIDHIVPESQGGKTEKANLQTLCKSCNSKKATKAEG